MSDSHVDRPGGARAAVTLASDFDAETLWLSRDPDDARRPGVLSQGTYGAKVGVPKILEALREEAVKATSFVPGWTAENHTARREAIPRGGHEVAHHSCSRRWIDPDSSDQEREEMERGLDALERVLGVVPRGYGPPAGETSGNMVRLLHGHGFLYGSSLLDDVVPYRSALLGGGPGPVELPWHWEHGRCAARAVLHQEPAPDLPERPPARDLPGRVQRAPPLGRALQPRHAPPSDRPPEPGGVAAGDDRLDAPLPRRVVRHRHGSGGGLGRGARADLVRRSAGMRPAIDVSGRLIPRAGGAEP